MFFKALFAAYPALTAMTRPIAGAEGEAERQGRQRPEHDPAALTDVHMPA